MFRDYVQTYPDGTPRTRHVTTNLIIDAESSDRATATSAVTVFQQTDELPLQPIIGTRNFDRFEKVDGVWRFSCTPNRDRLVREPVGAHAVAG